MRHTLGEHFDKFYDTRKTETEGPKGNFAFVAQCGVTNEYLGAPNHHDYQNRLVTFHAERLSRMPFEKFKSRIRIVKEEEASTRGWNRPSGRPNMSPVRRRSNKSLSNRMKWRRISGIII